MRKALGRFFAGAVMVWGIWLLGLPASARAQGAVTLYTSADTGSGVTRQSLPQVIHVFNFGTAEATGVTVTFSPPKGVTVDSTCQVDHLPGGLRSYTCLVGTIAAGGSVDVSISVSMNKPGDASFTADATCDQGSSFSVPLPITIS